MENELVSIYENNYLQRNVVEEKKSHKPAAEEGDAPKKGKFKSKKKFMKKSKDNIGAITYDSVKREDNIFDQILREMDEFSGGAGAGVDAGGGDDNIFDAGGDDFGGEEEGGGDEQSFTLSELKNMTLSELADLIGGVAGDEEDEFGGDDEFGFEDEGIDDGDEIPQESYGFTGGEGNEKGDQGNYDGKAKRQPKSNHVKDNGDANIGKSQDTGYDPDDTEGSEGAEHGAQGNYDGKAKTLPKTTHVKGNGDADFGKSKTGHKTSSGKKEKNYF